MALHNNFSAPALGLAEPAPVGARHFAVVAPMGAVGGTSVQLAAAQRIEAPGWQAEGAEGNIEPNSTDCAHQAPQVQVTSAAGPTMTSLKLVEFINSQRSADETELRHDHFMAKVPKVLGTGAPKFRDTYIHHQNGQPYHRYRFPKREASLMAMSYSYELQARVFERMTQLEQAAAASALPDFADPAAAAIAWAEQFRAKQALALQNAAQAEALAIAAPKAAGLDRISSASEGAVSVSVAANLADVPQSDSVTLLLVQGWLYRRGGRGGLLGRSDKESAGFVETKRVERQCADGSLRAFAQTFITQRGLAKVAELIERKAPHLRKAKTAATRQQIQLVLQMLATSAQEWRAP